MKSAMDPDSLPPKLREKAMKANPLQKAAYNELLQNLPCGVGIVPGGPGGGKTFFNLYLTAMAQAEPIEYEDEDGVMKQRRVKILYLVDINSPVDDATNKCVKMSEKLGDDKKIVRMFGMFLTPLSSTLVPPPIFPLCLHSPPFP
jgi:regulator of nonsense transcripts 1